MTFESTHWSMIIAAGDADAPNAEAALTELCHTYWPPVFAFVRRRLQRDADAEDMTQEFFRHLFETGLVGAADPTRGRFRSFLLKSLTNFMNGQREAQQALKRGGGHRRIPLDIGLVSDVGEVPVLEHVTAEKEFERNWARCLIQTALGRLEFELNAAGESKLFRALKDQITSTASESTYIQIGEQIELTESGVKSAVFRLRKRFGRLLRAEIGRTVVSEADVEDEIRQLFQVLAD